MPSLLHLFSIVSTEVRKIAAASSNVAEVAAIWISCRSSFNENRVLRFFAISFLGLGRDDFSFAGNISTQPMLKTPFEILSTMADDPDKYRARLKAKLFEAADTMPRAEMAPAREDMVRAFVRETINVVLTNSRPN
jgi:hypothetical protein